MRHPSGGPDERSPSTPFQRLFAELKRRRVLRVAVVYFVGAVAAVEAADAFFPALHLPAWTVTLVAALVVIGFPVTLALAWAFDLTSEGIRRTDEPGSLAPGGAGSGASSRTAVYLGLGILAVFGSAALGALYLTGPDSSRGTIRSVAVLPFVSMSPEEENEYFSDGVTEEILNALAQLEGLPS